MRMIINVLVLVKRNIRMIRHTLFAFLYAFMLSNCTVKDGPPKKNIDVNQIPNAVPCHLPKSKYGNRSYTSINGIHYDILKSGNGYDATGIASWYGTKFDGQLTSSGEIYHMFGMTAAHRTLPLPSFVRVTNLSNGRSVIVKVNDRGPFVKNRLIDLSYAAAKKLDITPQGTGFVRVTEINSNKPDIATPYLFEQSQSLYVQVAAFQIKKNATKFIHKLSKITNYPILMQKAFVNGHVLYRIQVGPIKNRQESLALKKKLLIR